MLEEHSKSSASVSSRAQSWLHQYGLILALLASSSLAYLWPEELVWDPFRLPTTGLRILVAMTMFCLGLVVHRSELRELKEHPLSVALGVAVQCTLMPALAWAVVIVLQLEGELAQGVILVGCVPGAMASNVLTMTAGGNVSYSVSLTTVATLISPLSVPVALAIISRLTNVAGEFSSAQLSPLEQSLVLLTTVVIPVVAGFLFKEWQPRLAKRMIALAPIVASIALLWIIASVVAGNRERLQQIELTLVVALLTINLMGYLGGFASALWAGLPSGMRKALALEVGMQNAGLGTFLAALLFGADSAAQIPTAAYTFGCMLTGTVLAVIWSRTVPSAVDALAASGSS